MADFPALKIAVEIGDRDTAVDVTQAGIDEGVPPENSILFYLALRKVGVPAEMHIYEKGPHGFGLGRA